MQEKAGKSLSLHLRHIRRCCSVVNCRSLCSNIALLLASRDNVVDPKEQDSRFNGSLEHLKLDREWFPDAKSRHVRQLSCLPVDTPVHILLLLLGVLRSQGGEGSDGVGATVLCKSSWDNLQTRGDSLVRPLDNTFQGLCLLSEQVSHFHLCGTSARHQCRLLVQVPCHIQSILQVPLHLVQDVLASPAEKDGASFWVLALLNEGEVLVSNLPDLKETSPSSNVLLSDLICPVDDCRPAGASNPQVVRLSQSPDRRDACFVEEVLSQVRDALLGDHQVWLEGGDLVTDLLDVCLLLLQDLAEVTLVHDLNVGLGLSFLVLKVAVQQEDPGVLNLPLHLRMSDILVEHDTLQH